MRPQERPLAIRTPTSTPEIVANYDEELEQPDAEEPPVPPTEPKKHAWVALAAVLNAIAGLLHR